MEEKNNIKRYDFVNFTNPARLEESEEGKYVGTEDVQRLLSDLSDLIKQAIGRQEIIIERFQSDPELLKAKAKIEAYCLIQNTMEDLFYEFRTVL